MRNLVKKSLKINGNTPQATLLLCGGDIGTSYFFSRIVSRSKKPKLSRPQLFQSPYTLFSQTLIDGLNSHQSEDVNPHLDNTGLKKYRATKSRSRRVYIQSASQRNNNASVLHHLDLQSRHSVEIGQVVCEEMLNRIRNGLFIESGNSANKVLAPCLNWLNVLTLPNYKRVKLKS